MTGDVWDTDLGQWALAWRDYLRGEPVASEVSVGAEPIVEDADAAFAREIALAREAADPKGLLPWLASLPDDGDGTVGSDAKYQQMLAEEACDEQIAADAATAFVPDVPLPFGGEVKSD